MLALFVIEVVLAASVPRKKAAPSVQPLLPREDLKMMKMMKVLEKDLPGQGSMKRMKRMW